MSAIVRKLRLLSSSAAAGALILGLAGCGDAKEPGASDPTSEATTSPAETAAETTPTHNDAASDGGVSGPTTLERSDSTTEPDEDESPGGGEGHPDDEQPTGDEVGPLENLPASAKVTVDPTPLTEDELKRGRDLPAELVHRVLDGKYEEACELLVAEEGGEMVRLDAPELQKACILPLKESVEGPQGDRESAEEALEEASPERMTLRDRHDGTAEFLVDGSPIGMTLVRLDDGSLRLVARGLL
ncbi:hypothetical protein [Dermabacter sp. Marseille-Q3180]|uniref:hypothetical protein n=1 Tax=Dermabacter sp. Marseille-Q3180 TaxID=2758090 RepID=UPI0020244AAD|nr:hypothetical protein [Dermabacter sp. Marseille-Q3180]